MKRLNIDVDKFISDIDISIVKIVLFSLLIMSFIFRMNILFNILFLFFVIGELLSFAYSTTVKYSPETHPIVAIDIDGTILESGYYPDIGEPYEYVIETINRMHKHGYNIVIWSTRSSKNIIECRKLLLNHGLNKDINFKIPNLEESREGINVSKVPAFVYLDNRNYGTTDDYSKMWKQIHIDFLGVSPKKYKRILDKQGYVNIKDIVK